MSPRTAPADPREYYFPYLNPLHVWGRLCICGDCDHAQWDGPGSKPIRGTGVFAPGLEETLQCGQPLLTGTLLGATGQVQSLVQTSSGDFVESRALDGGGQLPKRRYAPGSVVAATGTSRGAIVARENGDVELPSGRLLLAPDPKDEDRYSELRRIWASSKWVLWTTRAQQRIRGLEVARSDGSFRAMVFDNLREIDGVGHCGMPLMGDHVLVIENDQSAVVALPLTGAQGWFTELSALTENYCVAGDASLLVVSGHLNGNPAVALGELGALPSDVRVPRKVDWQVVALPWSAGVVEATIAGSKVLVSAPREDVKSGERQVEGAGAVYILGRDDGRWRIERRVIAAEPRRFGLFGFVARLSEGTLWANHLVDDPKDARGERFGTPVICEATVPAR